MASKRTAIVLGGSGSVGTALLRELFDDDGFYAVITLLRRSLAEAVAMARAASRRLVEKIRAGSLSILWLLHPWACMLRCREVFDSSEDLHARRSAVELLRVVADARALPWVDDFLADPDPQIQSWGILVIDQLLMGDLADREACEPFLARARLHPNEQVREAVTRIEQLDSPAQE